MYCIKKFILACSFAKTFYGLQVNIIIFTKPIDIGQY